MIEFSCDCGKSYTVKDESAGRQGKCKECGEPITVPTPAAKKGARPRGKPGGPTNVAAPATGAGPGGAMPWDEAQGKNVAKVAKKCGASPIYLIAAARRFFKGEGTAEFREDTLRVRGTLGVEPFETILYWAIASVVGYFVVTLLPMAIPFATVRRLIMTWGPPVFLFACAGYLVYHIVTGREMKTLFVKADKVKSVDCEGPIVTIKCKADLAPGLNTIRMFVSPGFRLTFFRGLDKMFPGKLPDNYRAAVQSLKGADEY